MMANLTLYSVKAIILLDGEGQRLLAKYYSADFATVAQQYAFEKSLFDKTRRNPAGDVVMFDGWVTAYRNNIDVFFYVVGAASENELILASVLSTWFDTFQMLLNQVERRTIIENLDAALLVMDELIDGGIILETDSSQIVSRVSFRPEGAADTPLSEQTIAQALQTAKSITKSLLK